MLGVDVGEISPAPVLIENESWQAGAAGGVHTVAIREDGSLWSWGANDDGQLGRNDFEDDALPGRVGMASDWQMVAAGEAHTLALRENGDLYAWGNNFYGDRKSTRLNSSHVAISYAVFCLK